MTVTFLAAEIQIPYILRKFEDLDVKLTTSKKHFLRGNSMKVNIPLVLYFSLKFNISL